MLATMPENGFIILNASSLGWDVGVVAAFPKSLSPVQANTLHVHKHIRRLSAGTPWRCDRASGPPSPERGYVGMVLGSGIRVSYNWFHNLVEADLRTPARQPSVCPGVMKPVVVF
jgi:hypothetical protein